MIVPRDPQSAAAVADYYDELDSFYREIWGEHVHHGYWATGRETAADATEALIGLLAGHIAPRPGQRLCDIGCGYGATALRLAERYGCDVTGITISPVQAARERARASPAVEIVCGDWLENGFPDASFDRAYAIESSEHMADKPRFFREAYRTLQAGGRLCVLAWLAHEGARGWEIRHLLEPICREGRLPGLGTAAEYRDLAAKAGFRVTRFDDVSRRVRRTWTICARRLAVRIATDPAYRRYLLDGRSGNRAFALSLARLVAAYRTGAMRYGVLVADKPL